MDWKSLTSLASSSQGKRQRQQQHHQFQEQQQQQRRRRTSRHESGVPYPYRIGAVNKQQLIAALNWKLGTDGYIIKVSRFLPQ